MLGILQTASQLLTKHVPLSPTVWFRISQLVVYLTAALKFLEIVVFAQSSMLCHFNEQSALANASRTSTQDYITGYCNLTAKKFGHIPFGTFDSLMILVATGIYLGIIRGIKTELELLRQHIEAFPVEILTPTSCRLSSVDRDKLMTSVKWQQARKRLLILIAFNASMIFTIGAILYFVVMGNVEFLKPFQCDFTEALPKATDLKVVSCVLAEVGLLEFLHASNFFLNIIGSVLFIFLGLSTLNFLRLVAVDGIVTYESEKFDQDRKDAEEQIANILGAGDIKSKIDKAKGTMVGRLVQRVAAAGGVGNMAADLLSVSSEGPIHAPAPSSDDPTQHLLRSTPLD
eukprot:TRINITY_DN70014_c0_g1_i1.p1 TRINITY_DN70014_c0_g1~~TRINITY_DN70014_c0_g1_i1.p1  ORF type:complete len:344 (+),score=56.17 TRINITY_DN70014_c0_g1_i1:46-1077(+)